jgi:hypothetical protein
MSATIHVSARHSRIELPVHSGRLLQFARLALRWALILASMLGALALGLYTQVYDGTFDTWLAREFSGAVYALAWCLGLALIRPNARPILVGSVAAVICFAIEVSQLWHPHALEVARATLPGRLVLGSAFTWTDLPYYAAGACVGAAWLRLLPFRRTPARRDRGDNFVRPMGVRG